MTKGSADNSISLPIWLIRLCAWCWRRRSILFGTVFLTTILNLVASLALVDPSTLHTLPIAWLISHWLLLLIIFMLLLLVTTVCGLIAHLPVTPSSRQLRIRYLERMMRETEQAML